MPTVPLHPAIVHVPLGLAFVLPLLSVGLVLAIRRGLVPRRAWALAVALQATLVVAGVAARWAGERDEKRVERVVGDRPIETHEQAAEVFLWGASIVLMLAATVLILPRRAATAAAAATALGTFVVAALAYGAGKSGGEIVYARGGAAAFATSPGPPPAHDHALSVREEDDD